jgi:hypothetical protein
VPHPLIPQPACLNNIQQEIPMPCAIMLRAIPGHFEDGPGYRSRVLEILGDVYGERSIPAAANLADIAKAVKAFGQDISAVRPGVSFQIMVSIRKGSRKPNGFDAADHENGFGQDDYMKVLSGAS